MTANELADLMDHVSKGLRDESKAAAIRAAAGDQALARIAREVRTLGVAIGVGVPDGPESARPKETPRDVGDAAKAGFDTLKTDAGKYPAPSKKG